MAPEMAPEMDMAPEMAPEMDMAPEMEMVAPEIVAPEQPPEPEQAPAMEAPAMEAPQLQPVQEEMGTGIGGQEDADVVKQRMGNRVLPLQLGVKTRRMLRGASSMVERAFDDDRTPIERAFQSLPAAAACDKFCGSTDVHIPGRRAVCDAPDPNLLVPVLKRPPFQVGQTIRAVDNSLVRVGDGSNVRVSRVSTGLRGAGDITVESVACDDSGACTINGNPNWLVTRDRRVLRFTDEKVVADLGASELTLRLRANSAQLGRYDAVDMFRDVTGLIRMRFVLKSCSVLELTIQSDSLDMVQAVLHEGSCDRTCQRPSSSRILEL